MFHSPFFSRIVTIQVGESHPGQTPKLFRLHSDILLQSLVFRSEIARHAYDLNPIVVTDVTAPVFDLIVRFLYGTPFESWEHALTPIPECEEQKMDSLRSACEMFCFTLKYDLVELKEIVASYIREAEHVNYQSVLAAAKYVYTNAPSVEPWFREYVLSKTREALTDPYLADETWFVEIFGCGHNGLSREIFECYKSIYRISLLEIDTPVSERASVAEEGPCIDAENEATPLQSPQAVPCEEADEGYGFCVEKEEGVELSEKSPIWYNEAKLEETTEKMPAEEDILVEKNVPMKEELLMEEELSVKEELPVKKKKGKKDKKKNMKKTPLGEEMLIETMQAVEEEPEPLRVEVTSPCYATVSAEEVACEEVPSENQCLEVPCCGEITAEEPAIAYWEEPTTIEEPAVIEDAVTAYYEPTSGGLIKFNSCPKRRTHLKNMFRWQNCSSCKEEVVAMAERASRE